MELYTVSVELRAQGDTDTFIYQTSPGQPWQRLRLPAKIGENVNWRNALTLASMVVGPEVAGPAKAAMYTGFMAGSGDYLDYLSNKYQGYSKDIGVPDAVKARPSNLRDNSYPNLSTRWHLSSCPSLYNLS